MNLLVSALEPSADQAAARVVAALRHRGPVDAFGLGGPKLAGVGVTLLADTTTEAAMGVGDVLRGLGRVGRLWASLRQAARARQPEVALLVDSSDFHLPLARALRSDGVKVLQYIGPQVYAWRRRRIGLVARRVDALASILPFEPGLYAGTGLWVESVGHPLLDEPLPRSRLVVRAEQGIAPDAPMVALLPGSRQGEIDRHLPAMREASELLARQGIKSIIVPPSAALRARDALNAADAAIAASGTVTLEAALCGCPTVVIYKLDLLSYAAARCFLRIPYMALPSWIAGQAVLPELTQGEVTGTLLARAVSELLRPEVGAAVRDQLKNVALALGTQGPASRVADMIWQLQAQREEA